MIRASWTWYTSYASCCPNNPNYDPNANRSECTDFSACQYPGEFAYIPHQTFQQVQSKSLVAFFTRNGSNGSYGGKTIQIMAGGKVITAQIADTCGDSDCNGCCTQNAQPSGNLIDMEYWTVMRNFGGTSIVGGQICWQLSGATPPVPAPVPTPVKAPVPTPVKAPVPTPVKAPVPAPTSSGTCGNGIVGNGKCSNGQCCSKWGWCGTTVDYCGAKLGDWAACSTSSQCSNGCCSKKYSGGALKCTPLSSGFDPKANGCV